MSKEYTKINVNIGGCKNCLSSIHHVIGIYGGIEKYTVNFEAKVISVHPIHAKRVISLLNAIGWNIEYVDNHPSVPSQFKEAEMNDDLHFLPLLEKDLEVGSASLCKRICLDNNHSISTQQNLCTMASKLVSILPHEVECCRSHLIPGWCVLVHSGPHLSKINQYLQTFLPLPEKLNHIKRIDSCRSNRSGSTYVFLNIAESRFTWLDANHFIASMIESLNLNSSENEIINTSPTPCWLPLHPPLTRNHQVIYSFCSKSREKNFSSFMNLSLKPIVMGWPCILRACPELEELLIVGRDLLSSYFSKLELERHSSWLERVTDLSKKTTEISGVHPQSCAGLGGPVCAAIIVDPETDIALAESTTATADTSYLDHAVLLAVSSVATLKRKAENQYSEIYLCTGLDVYVSLEPCLMCGMALLHNRIRQVFCCQRLKGSGAFTNASRLHVQEQLNHHFRVFAPL
ncbi:unnamed protein product [Heterobilharzia americana]|nr:unnamed protein product [Heterobilharzia americana]